jgi:primosomal protein N' (replication factor Y) (superfamily II helicase)
MAPPDPKAGTPPMARRARVLLDGKIDLLFDYSIPPALERVLAAGCRVMVSVRHRNASGTVIEIVPDDGSIPGLKPVARMLDEEPLLTPVLLKLARWLSDYYLCPIASVITAMMPTAVRAQEDKFAERLSVSLTKSQEESLVYAEQLVSRAPRQASALRYLAALGEPVIITELERQVPGATGAVKGLAQKGLVTMGTTILERDPYADETFLADTVPSLTQEQVQALEEIKRHMQAEAPSPILLHGVTGSGKTEVYLQLMQKVIEDGKSALVLVPEISLTPQTAERFKSRFSTLQKQIAVMHSGLSQGEWHDEWHKLRKAGQAIAIGPRSAVFAPLANLGLIIVDEEHETSYKQDSAPRYNGRDAAIVRAGMEKCAIVLGSATPSLESYANTLSGKYHLVSLTKRVDNRSLPLFRLVDMRMQSRGPGGKPEDALISARLREAVEQRLERKEQTILFLNRRGYARALTCPTCGYTATCEHCSCSLTFHHKEDILICHVCGYRRKPFRQCPVPECRDAAIKFAGFGTEKIEVVTAKLFPTAKVARIDSDTMARKDRLREMLRDFRAGRIDILVGTQMIAKGLDFPNVTLVGVLNADTSLHMPDFRAGERTFQLLTQVAGRAGRGEMEGEVFVQTFAPHSHAIQFARHHDFRGFADEELETRRQFRFPPFARTALLQVRSEDQELASRIMEKNVHDVLIRSAPETVEFFPPAPAALEKAHGQFRFHCLIRSPHARLMIQWLKAELPKLTIPKNVILTWDIDPVSLM